MTLPFNLTTDPWIPTTAGLRSLLTLQPTDSLHCSSALEHATLLRFLISLHGYAKNDLSGYLLAHHAGFTLLDPARPFLQTPLAVTRTLRLQSITVMQLARMTGSSHTLYGLGSEPDQDDHPRPLTHDEAARALLTFQNAALSNGKSAWSHTLDAPLARIACFFAEGSSLADTLALNVPLIPPHTLPVWEQPPEWSYWRAGRPQPLTAWNALCFPWFTITIDPDLRHVRFAGGPVPELGRERDPHLLTVLRDPSQPFDEKKNPILTLKNPNDLCSESLLIRALSAALDEDVPDAHLPVGFQRARERGAQRVRVMVTASRPGQPVLLDTLECSLPWPRHSQRSVRDLLQRAQDVADQLRTAGVRLYAPLMGSKKARDVGMTMNLIRTYWQTLWPDLSCSLAGDGDPADLTVQQLHQHAQMVLRHTTQQILGQSEAMQSGIRLAHHVMKPAL